MNQEQNNNLGITPEQQSSVQNATVSQPGTPVIMTPHVPQPVNTQPVSVPVQPTTVGPTPVVTEHINDPTQQTIPQQVSSESVVPQNEVLSQPVSQNAVETEKPKKKKNNVPVLVIIIVLLAAIAFGIYYFLLGGNMTKKAETEPVENTEVNNEVVDAYTIKKELTTISQCQQYETNFNDVTVKLEAGNSTDNCVFDKVLVNDNDITNDVLNNIISYEVYDNNVIVLSNDTSGRLLTIYDVTSQSVSTKLRPETMEGYWVESYTSENDKLVIKGKECGQQCGNESSGFEIANFELTYVDGYFNTPVLISRMASGEE